MIKKLNLVNFKTITELDADFEGGIYFITGENQRGKSTVLEAITSLLTGERGNLLQKGKSKGSAKCVVSANGKDYEVSLSFTEKNPRGILSIKGEAGLASNNVSALKEIFGFKTFDAGEFASLSETAEGRRKQVEMVKSLLPSDVIEKISAIEAKIKETYSARTEANSSLSRISGAIETKGVLFSNEDLEEYKEEKPVSTLLESAQRRIKLEEKRSKAEEAVLRYESEIKGLENRNLEILEEIERLQNEIKSNKITVEELEGKKDFAKNWIKEYDASPKGTEKEDLEKLEAYNKKVREVNEYRKLLNSREAVSKEVDKLSVSLEMLRKEKQEIIKAASLPIDGLTFTEDGLELNNIPFAPRSVSDSEIMEVAVCLAIAANKNVKVFQVARGESLGAERLKKIVELAKKYKFQGFIEEVVRGQDHLDIVEYSEVEPGEK